MGAREMEKHREKRYVEVDVRFSTEGRLRPLQIVFDAGRVYTIDQVGRLPPGGGCGRRGRPLHLPHPGPGAIPLVREGPLVCGSVQ